MDKSQLFNCQNCKCSEHIHVQDMGADWYGYLCKNKENPDYGQVGFSNNYCCNDYYVPKNEVLDKCIGIINNYGKEWKKDNEYINYLQMLLGDNGIKFENEK